MFFRSLPGAARPPLLLCPPTMRSGSSHLPIKAKCMLPAADQSTFPVLSCGSPRASLLDLTCSRSSSGSGAASEEIEASPHVPQGGTSKDGGPRFRRRAKSKCDGWTTFPSAAAGSPAHPFCGLRPAHPSWCLLWNQAAATSNSCSDPTTNSAIPAPGPASTSYAFGQRWPERGQGAAPHAVWQRVSTPTPI